MALIVPLLIGVAISESSAGRLDARRIALLGVLASAAAMMRLPISFAGANLMFFLPIVCGAVFGPSFGFLLGSAAMGASAAITGGAGPWLPFQMFTMGWVGLGAGYLRPLIAHHKPKLAAALLAPYAAFAAMFYGAIMNLYFWPVVTAANTSVSWTPSLGLAQNIAHYRDFYMLTSLAWDSVGAIANVALALTLAPATIQLLMRYQRRFS